jgi:hypothetical protein
MIKVFMILISLSSFAWADGDYSKHEASLSQIAGQIATSEKKIRDDIEEKNKTTDPAKYHEFVADIKAALKKRKDDIAHYNKEFHHVRYEHPEKDDKFLKQYKRYDEKSIREFEDEINKLLSSVQENVKKKYNP